MSGHHYFGQPWPLCKYPKKIGFKFRKSSLYHLYSSLGTNYYLCLSNASPLLGPVSQCTLDPYWALLMWMLKVIVLQLTPMSYDLMTPVSNDNGTMALAHICHRLLSHTPVTQCINISSDRTDCVMSTYLTCV